MLAERKYRYNNQVNEDNSGNKIGNESGKVLAESLKANTTLTKLDVNNKQK